MQQSKSTSKELIDCFYNYWNRFYWQVCVKDIEKKVVALYLYEKSTSDELTERLKITHKKLKECGLEFEVVLANLDFVRGNHKRASEESFWKTFKTMPWLAVPYKDPGCRKLGRLFCYPFDFDDKDLPNPSLVIVGAKAEFVEPYGVDILMNFGIEAYPFRREAIVKLEVLKGKEVKFDKLFDREMVFSRKKDMSIVSSFLDRF